MLDTVPKLFGGRSRTRALIAIALLQESYVRQLAQLVGVAQPTMFKIIDDLEKEGVLVSRYVGRTRVVSFNPRLYGAPELRAFLLKYAKQTDIEDRVALIRRRPRRRGKAL